MDFIDKTVIITGGTRGLGKELATQFFDERACVIVTGTKDITKYYFNIAGSPYFIYHQLDFLDNLSISNFLDFIGKFRHIDILINNAGLYSGSHWQVMQVNLFAPAVLLAHVADMMKKQGGGHIVNISSVAGLDEHNSTSYAESKRKLIDLTKVKALELAEHNIMINAVCPGSMDTDMLHKNLSEKQIKERQKNIPLKRLATVKDVAKAVLFLCRDNTYITGQTIVVDGGFTINKDKLKSG